jgi:hypothetical protein
VTVSFWFYLVIVNLLGHGDITPNQCPRKPAPPQRLQEKMQDTGRGSEHGGKNAENFEVKEKRGMTDFPKRE